MADIFLSYSSKDKERVKPLVRALEREGWSVWWDQKTLAGESYNSLIDRELRGAQCVVVVWSEHSISSEWVYEEATLGKQRNALIPAKIDPVNIPLGFGLLQAVDLVGWTGYSTNPAFQHLVVSIAEKIGRKAPPSAPKPTPERKEPVPPPPPAPSPSSQKQEPIPKSEPVPPGRRNLLIGGLTGGLLAIALIAGWMTPDDPEPPSSQGRQAPSRTDTVQSSELKPPSSQGGQTSSRTVTVQSSDGQKVDFDMVTLPAGRFLMGSPPQEQGRDDDEGPQHPVTLPQFEIGKHEVTQRLWRAVMGTNPSRFKGDDLPVESVSWNEAQEFCRRLSEKLGLNGSNGYRLPSEAEWEYAARAGTTTPFAFGQNIDPGIVNYDGNYPYGDAAKGLYRQKTVPVGSLGRANGWGLFDLHGNVWEWVEDQYHGNYNGAPSDGRAWTGLAGGSYRVIRGGGWYGFAVYCRSARRDRIDPGSRFAVLGFRLLRTLP